MATGEEFRMVGGRIQGLNQYALFRKRYLGMWIKDSDQQTCMTCRCAFSLFRRRHHCRFCGRLFCANCSSKTLSATRFIKSVRTCDDCHRSRNLEHQLPADNEHRFVAGGLWIPFEWVPFCMCCAEIFNWMRSKTHCRNCGQVVCKGCCNTKRRLEYCGYLEPVPVCERCVREERTGNTFRRHDNSETDNSETANSAVWTWLHQKTFISSPVTSGSLAIRLYWKHSQKTYWQINKPKPECLTDEPPLPARVRRTTPSVGWKFCVQESPFTHCLFKNLPFRSLKSKRSQYCKKKKKNVQSLAQEMLIITFDLKR